MNVRSVVSGMARVSWAELYYEVRGSGPPLLLVHGTNLDCGCYTAIADILADTFTVVTYDRRGYSRSPRPEGWTKTSIEEQAEDAAGLLQTLGTVPAIVFGSSSAGPIVLELAMRHPDLVSTAIVHEAAFFTALPQEFTQEEFGKLNPVIEAAVAAEGPKGGQRTLLDLLSEHGFDAFEPAIAQRWLGNAELVFGMEFPQMLLAYAPSEADLAALKVPVRVMRADQSIPLNAAAAELMASKTGSELHVAPGGHLAYIERPEEFAAALRPILELKR
jgi:pimeloyl-ACP methyl ester carboxylesterase